MSEHILIIEDDLDIANIERDYLMVAGYDVTIMTNGTDGIEAALNTPVDLIILDVMLPEMDGFEVLTYMNKYQWIHDIPVMIISSENSGKYIGGKDLEQTVYRVNREATIEIAKQLRLRDIGGIIIIDYIDMEKDETKNKILEELNECLKKDRSKNQIIGFTPLDLLEMTRKHMCSND